MQQMSGRRTACHSAQDIQPYGLKQINFRLWDVSLPNFGYSINQSIRTQGEQVWCAQLHRTKGTRETTNRILKKFRIIRMFRRRRSQWANSSEFFEFSILDSTSSFTMFKAAARRARPSSSVSYSPIFVIYHLTSHSRPSLPARGVCCPFTSTNP